MSERKKGAHVLFDDWEIYKTVREKKALNISRVSAKKAIMLWECIESMEH